MKRFLVAIFIVLMAWLSIYWWGRSAPLTKAQRAIDHGDPGEAVEILIEALDNGSLSLEKEEAMRELLAKSYWNKGAIDSSEQCLRLSLIHIYLISVHRSNTFLVLFGEIALPPNRPCSG